MTLQFSVAVRNARVSAIETVIGASPKIQIRTGAQPANCAAAATGTLLAEVDLPADWLGDPSNGSVSLVGTWEDVGVADGTAGHYRVVDSAGTTCHEQGSIGETDSGEDMELSQVAVVTGATVTITTWTRTDGNA